MGETIYAISLWQPWASFISTGLKRYETRRWRPPRWLIGKRIAIHAAKRPVSRDDKQWAADRGLPGPLPHGAVICTVILKQAIECGPHFLDEDEYGDYAEGRWAWELTDIRPLVRPQREKGKQGFWKVSLDG